MADHLSKFESQGIATTSAMGSSNLFKSDLDPLTRASRVTMFPDADEADLKYVAQVLAFCRIHDVEAHILNVTVLGWQDGENIADVSHLEWADIEPHLVGAESCVEAGVITQKGLDKAMILVAANMSDIDFNRAKSKIAERMGLGVQILKSERSKIKSRQPERGVDSEEDEPEGKELSPEEKRALRKEFWSKETVMRLRVRLVVDTLLRRGTVFRGI